jgi:hypothetical protein
MPDSPPPAEPAGLPPEVKAALADEPAPVHAVWAQVGASPESSLGETYLIAAERKLFALTRGSHFEPFVRLELAPGQPPEIRAEGFATWIELHLADGARARLPLTPFDLDAVKAVCTALGADPSPLPVVMTSTSGSAPGLEEAIEGALDLLVEAARRGAQRADLDFLRVRARIEHGGRRIDLESEYDAQDLSRLRQSGQG